jgi:sugar-specific transcriptional regulator TrmB
MKGINTLSLERIFKALVDLGLSESDARVYIFLALKGPKEEKILTNKLKISRQQIIRSLKNLQRKGIIFADRDNLKIFSALSFDKALKLLIKTEKEQTRIKEENLFADWKTMMKKNSSQSQES